MCLVPDSPALFKSAVAATLSNEKRFLGLSTYKVNEAAFIKSHQLLIPWSRARLYLIARSAFGGLHLKSATVLATC
jgi:hypothetical protein